MVRKNRVTWNTYFLSIAKLIATRSTCLRRSVGAVIVKDNQILATGYNGAVTGSQHCLDIGCIREKEGVPSGERQELCRAVHAEQNALIQAAKHGVAVEGATLYCTHQPCVTCRKMLKNAGIVKTIFLNKYPQMLKDSERREYKKNDNNRKN